MTIHKEDLVCPECEGRGSETTNDPEDHNEYRCRTCSGTGMNLELLARALNALAPGKKRAGSGLPI